MIELNVGGRIFATHESTLKNWPNSLLSKSLTNPTAAKDAKGRLFFDRNPELFAELLDAMRAYPQLTAVGYGADQEADYFGLPFECTRFEVQTLDGPQVLPINAMQHLIKWDLLGALYKGAPLVQSNQANLTALVRHLQGEAMPWESYRFWKSVFDLRCPVVVNELIIPETSIHALNDELAQKLCSKPAQQVKSLFCKYQEMCRYRSVDLCEFCQLLSLT